jgi:hypothetical protein
MHDLPQFTSFEGYPPVFPQFNRGISAQTLRPIAPTPLQIHQQNYHTGGIPSYGPATGPLVPTTMNDAFNLNVAPAPLSADVLGSFQTGSTYLFGQGASNFQQASLQRHASISGGDAGYQRGSGPFSAGYFQERPSLGRSNSLASFDPMQNVPISQPPIGRFPPFLPSQVPQSTPRRDEGTPLTSTQLAAFNDQPLPPDHPFYPEMRANIEESRGDISSPG